MINVTIERTSSPNFDVIALTLCLCFLYYTARDLIH